MNDVVNVEDAVRELNFEELNESEKIIIDYCKKLSGSGRRAFIAMLTMINGGESSFEDAIKECRHTLDRLEAEGALYR